MSDIQLKILDVITSEYKKKKYSDLSEIEDKGVGFSYEYENQKYEVEVQVDKKLKDIIRVMIGLELDCFLGALRGKAKYFGKTKEGEVIENDDMVF